MASVKKRPDGKYRARYRDIDGREHSKHFEKAGLAQKWLDGITATIVTGTYVDPRNSKTKVRDYAATWESAQVGRAATVRITDNALRLHILPIIGDRPMHSVKPSDIQGLVKRLSADLAPGTVRNVYDTAARMFAAAVEDRLVSVTPCRRITLPRSDEAEVVIPTVDQVAALAESVDPRYRAAIIMLAGSGLRIGELLGLRRHGDVDFLRRQVRVERQRLQEGPIGPTKTPKSVRTVPLGQVVLDELASHLAEFGRGEWLFSREDGSPVMYRAWKPIWNGARMATGVDFTTHDLRHTFASCLIAGGASVKQVQTVLGHSSAVITLRTYAHLWPGDEDRTRSVIDAAFSVLRTGRGPGEEVSPIPAGQSG